MSLVIERCPNCGVEHELTHTGPCEVCGSELRFWCRRHSKETGWLSGPKCERCAMEAARPRPAPPTPTPRPTRTPVPTAGRRPPRGAPGTVRREPTADWRPHAARGGLVAWRMVKAALVIMRSVFVGALLFGIAGGLWGYQMYGIATGDGVAIHTLNRDTIGLALLGVIIGGTLGLLWGFVRAIRILFAADE